MKSIQLNEKLIEKQGLTYKEVEKLMELHIERHQLYQKIQSLDPIKDINKIRELGEETTLMEFRLQRAWKFPMNRDFHRFWEVPHCVCPVLDNQDRYGTGHFIMRENCPLHGNSPK